MFMQLRTGNTYSTVSWKRMFDVMLQLCTLFAEPEPGEQVQACLHALMDLLQHEITGTVVPLSRSIGRSA